MGEDLTRNSILRRREDLPREAKSREDAASPTLRPEDAANLGTQRSQPLQKGNQMKEYKVVHFFTTTDERDRGNHTRLLEQSLNQEARQGWELKIVFGSSEYFPYLIFERDR